MRDQTNQAIDAIAKMSPPAAVTFSNTLLNMPVEKWLTVLMIVYTVLQVFLLIRDRVIRRRRKTDKVDK